MDEHTKGPWTSQGWVPTWAYIPVFNANHRMVCALYPEVLHGHTHERVAANARLIAAAPDLLAALKALRDECSGAPRPSVLVGLLTDAAKAIAKAEGA